MGETPTRDVWFIATQPELDALCRQLAPASPLAVDTEFERQRTYYAELCLVQIAAPGVLACIDPFALDSLAPLSAALAAPAAPKLLHAARQDLEILLQAGGQVPAPVIDTQIAAGLAGYAENIGYADLVRELLGIDLDKSQTRTDWRQRPLTAAQLRYAADDVRHLGPLAERLLARLHELGRSEWLAEECRALVAVSAYDMPAHAAWQRIKGLAGLPPAAFARGVALATWRESTARQRNLPRGWVIRDDELVNIALVGASTWRTLVDSNGLDAAALRRYGDEIQASLDAAPQLLQEQPEHRRLTQAGRRHLKGLSAQVQTIAADLHIEPTVLISRRELEASICGKVPARLLDGWRRPILADLIATLAVDPAAHWWE